MKTSLKIVATIGLALLTLAFFRPHHQTQPSHPEQTSIDTDAMTRAVDSSALPVTEVHEPF